MTINSLISKKKKNSQHFHAYEFQTVRIQVESSQHFISFLSENYEIIPEKILYGQHFFKSHWIGISTENLEESI